jgi:hypothetical protein
MSKCPHPSCKRGGPVEDSTGKYKDGPCGSSDCMWPKADSSRGVLNERGSTHGDFSENGKVMQALKVLMREHWGWQKLDTAQREALEMIQHKIGRILCGNNNYFDHWRDIVGYAKLIEERCPKPEETTK